jgi:hypothetical protein
MLQGQANVQQVDKTSAQQQKWWANKFTWMCTHKPVPQLSLQPSFAQKIQHALESTCQTISTCNIIHVSVSGPFITWLYLSYLKAGMCKLWWKNYVTKHNHSHIFLTTNHLLVSQHTNWINAHYYHIMQGLSGFRWMQQFRISPEVLTCWICDFLSTVKSKVVPGHIIRVYRRNQ